MQVAIIGQLVDKSNRCRVIFITGQEGVGNHQNVDYLEFFVFDLIGS